MPANHSGQNLRGLSFRGQNLEGADFSYADIRSADFTNANLTRANFTNAKAGLQKRWVLGLMLLVLTLVFLSWLTSSLYGYLISFIFDPKSENQITGRVALITIFFFIFLTIRQGIAIAFGFMFSIFAFATTQVVAVALGAAVAETYNNQGDTTMTGDRHINTGGGNYNERIQGDYVQGNYYAASQPQSLAQAAAEIQELLKQLEQTYPTTTTSQQMVVAAEAINQIESSPTMKQKVINAVKEGGLAAFEKAIDNPAGAFVVGAIKGWQEIEAKD